LPPRDSASQNAVGGTADEKARLLVKRDSLNRELQTKQSQRERFSGGEKPPPAPKNPGGGPGSGGKGGGPPKPEPPVADHKNDEKSRQLKQLDSQIEKLFEERSRVDARLAELGEKLPDAPAGAPAKAAPVAVEPALLENDAIRIWSHDVTVERGKTYRYRIHVFVNNPIYGHGTALLPDQADLAKPVALRSAESEWSEPVKVDDQSYFFITSAQEQDPVTKGPKAAAEVYVFSWGFWRKGSVNLEPGDSLTAEVKLPDFEKALAAAAKPKPDPNQPDAPVPPAPPGEGGGGKNVRPAPGAPQPPEAPVDPDAPKTAEPVIFKQVKVENDALLLDVATTAAIGEEGFKSQKTEQQAYLRDSSGRIITRVPDQERQKRIYQRIARSATLGEEATQPKTAIIEPIRPIKPPTDPKKDKDKPAPSTGGG
jgi:hypothetical protein